MAKAQSSADAENPDTAALMPRRSQFTLDQSRDFFAKLQKSLPADVLKCSTGMQIGEQAKYVTWTIPTTPKYRTVELSQITDVQFGHIACKYERVIEYRDWILSEPNRFMLWTGDNVDAWAMWSPGRAFDQLGDPQSQVMKFVEVWGPARHRVLGYVGGNHERRALPGFGDLGTLIAMLLGIPYSNGRQLIDIRYGQHNPFQISLWHGVGGARTKGTVAQILDRFMSRGDSQVYLMGHLHQPMIIPGWREVREPGQNRIGVRKCFGAVGSSFLSTWGTYGEIAGYSSHDVLMPRIVLEPNGKYEVTLK